MPPEWCQAGQKGPVHSLAQKEISFARKNSVQKNTILVKCVKCFIENTAKSRNYIFRPKGPANSIGTMHIGSKKELALYILHKIQQSFMIFLGKIACGYA